MAVYRTAAQQKEAQEEQALDRRLQQAPTWQQTKTELLAFTEFLDQLEMP
jgi:hypothetical protein